MTMDKLVSNQVLTLTFITTLIRSTKNAAGIRLHRLAMDKFNLIFFIIMSLLS